MTEEIETAPDAEQPSLPGIITADGVVPETNERADAPTIYADAVQGVMLSTTVVKISFLEHFFTEGEAVNGRYVLNLAMPQPQLRAMGELFLRLAGEVDQVMKNG